MRISLTGFQGVIPSIDATMIPEGAAQSAQDCKLGSGGIKPLRIASSVATPSKSGTKSTIWKYVKDSVDYWFHWVAGQDVNAVKSPLPNDAWDRIYWTGDGAPKMASFNVATTGGTGYPVNSRPLGLPAPAQPSAVRVGTAAEDPVDDKTRAYVIRYVSDLGEPGPASLASATFDWSPGNTATVTLPTTVPSGYTGIIATIGIFRANTGTSDTAFQFVADVAIGTASYSDEKTDDELGYVLDSAGYLAPNANMIGLIALPNGCLAGFYKNVLCLSEPYLPHAYPADNQYSLADDIVSIASFGNSILITTKGVPCVATGATPSAMSVDRFEEGYACISKRGTVDMGYSVLYPTPMGLYQVGVNGAKMVTEGVCTIDEWQALQMETARAYTYDGKYFAFTDTGNYCFNPADGTYTTLSEDNTGGEVTAGYADPATGFLYLMAGSSIVKYDGGSTVGPYRWKSKKHVAPEPVNLAVGQVFGLRPVGTQLTDVFVTLNITADGTTRQRSITYADLSKPVRLPSGFLATYWEIELVSSAVVTKLVAATSFAELAES